MSKKAQGELKRACFLARFDFEDSNEGPNFFVEDSKIDSHFLLVSLCKSNSNNPNQHVSII
jgi:hypothetical protein